MHICHLCLLFLLLPFSYHYLVLLSKKFSDMTILYNVCFNFHRRYYIHIICASIFIVDSSAPNPTLCIHTPAQPLTGKENAKASSSSIKGNDHPPLLKAESAPESLNGEEASYNDSDTDLADAMLRPRSLHLQEEQESGFPSPTSSVASGTSVFEETSQRDSRTSKNSSLHDESSATSRPQRTAHTLGALFRTRSLGLNKYLSFDRKSSGPCPQCKQVKYCKRR